VPNRRVGTGRGGLGSGPRDRRSLGFVPLGRLSQHCWSWVRAAHAGATSWPRGDYCGVEDAGGGSRRGGERAARRSSTNGCASPRAARRHRPLDQPDRDPVGGRGRSAGSNPDAVPAFLSAISAPAAGARGDARVLAGCDRTPSCYQPRGAEPQPGLEQVGELIASLRAGGLESGSRPSRCTCRPNSADGLPDRAGVADPTPQHAGPARSGFTIIRSGRNGAGLGTRRPARTSGGPGTAHGDRRDARAGSAYGGTLRTGARRAAGSSRRHRSPCQSRKRR